MTKPVLRLCEWGSVLTRNVLTAAQREAIAQASDAWRTAHRLPALPLEFRGPHGDQLTARQYVGVVEVGGATIEIYPKLDAALLGAQTLPRGAESGVLRNLLWLLEVTSDDRPQETGTAGLAETDTPFLEMFALWLARRLRAELSANGGSLRRYEAHTGFLGAVRGQVWSLPLR